MSNKKGRGPALNRLVESARRKQHQKKQFDITAYDGRDIDNPEAEPAWGPLTRPETKIERRR